MEWGNLRIVDKLQRYLFAGKVVEDSSSSSSSEDEDDADLSCGRETEDSKVDDLKNNFQNFFRQNSSYKQVSTVDELAGLRGFGSGSASKGGGRGGLGYGYQGGAGNEGDDSWHDWKSTEKHSASKSNASTKDSDSWYDDHDRSSSAVAKNASAKASANNRKNDDNNLLIDFGDSGKKSSSSPKAAAKKDNMSSLEADAWEALNN